MTIYIHIYILCLPYAYIVHRRGIIAAELYGLVYEFQKLAALKMADILFKTHGLCLIHIHVETNLLMFAQSYPSGIRLGQVYLHETLNRPINFHQ